MCGSAVLEPDGRPLADTFGRRPGPYERAGHVRLRVPALHEPRRPRRDVVFETDGGRSRGAFVPPARRPRARPSGPGPRRPAPTRGRAIQQTGRLVEANKEALARLVTREIGKPYAEALGEVQEIVDTCDFFLGEGRRLYGQTVPSRDARQAAVHVPRAGRRRGDHHGGQLPGRRPVLVSGARAAVRQRRRLEAGRLRAGDAPTRSRSSSGTAGCPTACCSVVHADGPTTFAGPRAGARGRAGRQGRLHRLAARSAREIGELCGRHLQNPCLELGGKNPMVVMDDADLDLAVEGALFGGFGTAGQRCTSLGTAIVARGRVRRVPRAASARRSSRRAIGDPTQDVLYGPMIHERFLERFEEYLGLIARPPRGARLDRHRADHRGQPAGGFVGDPERGLFAHPTIVAGVRVDDELANTETFGPLVGVATLRHVRRGDRAGQRATATGCPRRSTPPTRPTRFRFRERITAGW